MKAKLGILLTIIMLSICYALWKNSTMVEIDFDDLFNQVEVVTIGDPKDNFVEPPTVESPTVISQYDVNPDTLQELYEACDVVAIVQPVSRKQKITVVNTDVEIKKIYKSDYQVGQEISLFEGYHLQYDTYQGVQTANLFTSSGYIPMDMNKEYLVFLKKSLKYTTDQFGFISLLYGKFPYITQEPKVLELEVSSMNGIRDVSFEELNQQDVVEFNIAFDEANPATEFQKEQTYKYEQYKENYMQILMELMDKEYQFEQLL